MDYILADSHTDFPQYPLEHPVPKNIPVITFPEISMWGRAPWGATGRRRCRGGLNSCSARPSASPAYSEGLCEDINKEVVNGLYVDPSAKVDDLLRAYAAYYLPGTDPEDFVKLCDLFEANHRFPGNHSHPRFGEVPENSPELAEYRHRAAQASRLAVLMDGQLLPPARSSFRGATRRADVSSRRIRVSARKAGRWSSGRWLRRQKCDGAANLFPLHGI